MLKKGILPLSIEKRIPLYLFFELTKRCNLNCLHCYVTRKKKRELSTREIKEILVQLKEADSLIVNFSGGEVFQRPDFLEIARYAKKQKFAVKIFTNGTLIDLKKAKEIAALAPLRVEITIYSTNTKVHDRITRVPGSLKLSLRALEELTGNRVPLRIKCPLMKHNARDYKAVIGLAKSLKCQYQIDPTIFPKTDGSKRPLGLRIEDEDLKNVLTDPLLREDLPRDRGSGVPCSAGHNSCAISSYGDVYPCVMIPVVMGSLRREPFKDIWYGSGRLERFRNIRRHDLKECDRCKISSSCARCPGLAYLEDRDLFGPSKRACQIAKIKARSYPRGSGV